MGFISIKEIIDIIVMSAFLGYLFMDFIKLNREETFFEKFKRAVIVISPSIIIHELAHKFTAMAFGLQAIFHAFYSDSFTLGLGILAILSKLTNFGFVFLVPGYVSICPGGEEACITVLAANPLLHSIIAFAGPLTHLIFWITSSYILKKKNLSENKLLFWTMNKKINMFLFILNMLPLPGIDGWQVYTGIFRAIG